MRQLFIAILLCMLSVTALAQDITLTKGETVAYLDKKIKEVEGYSQNGWPEGLSVKDCSVEFKNGRLIITQSTYKNENDFRKEEYSFNPLYIESITDYSYNDKAQTVHIMFITLSTKSIRHQTTHPLNYVKWPLYEEKDAQIYYFNGGGKNFEKIKKALFHLQALLKAEDDPFGN